MTLNRVRLYRRRHTRTATAVFWAMVLMIALFALEGSAPAIEYIESRNFTEPMFVFVIMVIAGTRPILQASGAAVRFIARYLPLPRGMAMYFVVLAFVPLLGSFITEPAAMTLAALMLRDTLFAQPVSRRLQYATVGVLFVQTPDHLGRHSHEGPKCGRGLDAVLPSVPGRTENDRHLLEEAHEEALRVFVRVLGPAPVEQAAADDLLQFLRQRRLRDAAAAHTEQLDLPVQR